MQIDRVADFVGVQQGGQDVLTQVPAENLLAPHTDEQTVKTEHGIIKFRAGYLRVSYDAKSLDAVSKTPEHGWVRQYRRESSVAPSVNVNVKESA